VDGAVPVPLPLEGAHPGLLLEGVQHRSGVVGEAQSSPRRSVLRSSPTITARAATRIGADLYEKLEAPLLFRDHHDDIWYLFLDQYGHGPQG
jgi:hypothetical protein